MTARFRTSAAVERAARCALLLALLSACSAQPYVVSTLAGNYTAVNGYRDGVGISALFKNPQGAAYGPDGVLYVADTNNNMVRLVSPGGVVTTLAGSQTNGTSDGVGTDARFTAPVGVAVDSAGTAYVADTGNSLLRVVYANGSVVTLAGGGAAGFVDGQGTAARFSGPQAVAVDAQGNVYIADTANNAVRVVTPSSAVTTLAGNGTAGFVNAVGSAATFRNPLGVAVDTQGNVYVADSQNRALRLVLPGGTVTTYVGGTTGRADGVGTAAQFFTPTGVAIDSNGVLYVSDPSGFVMRAVSTGRVVTTFAGYYNGYSSGYIDAAGSSARFINPTGVAFNAAGTLVANAGAQVFGATGPVAITLVQGTVTAQPGLYFFAFTSAANVFSIIDGGNNTLALYRNTAFGASAAGALPATITPPSLGAPSLGGPWFNLF